TTGSSKSHVLYFPRMIRRFEITVIRPLYLALACGTVLMLFQKKWWLLVIGVAAMFCLGVVGSGLYPQLSDSDLGRGDKRVKLASASSLSLPQQLGLVERACTRVGLLIGSLLFFALLAFNWRWYLATPAAFLGCVFSGGTLMAIFRISYS